MKSATSYKAVAYQDDSLISGFWLGRAIDKQINSRVTEVSNYWVFDFLESGFQITPASGTRRLALAIREAARKAQDITVKSEITAAATLAAGFGGRRTSIRGFVQHLGLSPPAASAIVSELKAPSVADEQFQFDAGEFKSQVGYRSIELNNGGVLTAESEDFDQVFHRENLDEEGQRVRFSTVGEVVNDKLRKSR
jgi:hypothetical protein